MTTPDLATFLTQAGLPECVAAFTEAGVAVDQLADLSADDLKELGLNLGQRKRLEKALKAGPAATVVTAAPAPVVATPIPAEPAAPPKRLKLFLSYGRDQYADEVRALKVALEARGHEVWFDADHLKSGDWEHRIENGLAWCDRVVLTMTPHSVRRPDGYCLNELAKALERQRLIIPVLLIDVPNGAPTSICRIQYLDWRDAVPAVDKPERFQVRLARLCEAIEQDKLDFEGGQQRLIRILQPLNYAGDMDRHVARFLGRTQLFARLRGWLDDPAAAQVFWLCGGPGLGKSAIAAVLAHRWSEIGAVHFCVAGHADKGDPRRAILAIAYQLSTHLETYQVRLNHLELEREAEKDAKTLFDTLLVGPLARNFPAPPHPWVVIIDALDEATQADGSNPLAELIASDWGKLPSWLRLLVSSRPDAEVVSRMSGLTPFTLGADDAEQQADLRALLSRDLAALGKPHDAALLDRICTRSEGAFQYLVLLLEDIKAGRCDPSKPADLPQGMHACYRQSFDRRFRDVAAYKASIRPLLEIILASPEPIPLAILATTVGQEVFDVREGLSGLGSLISLQPATDGQDADWDTVKLAHASLRTWLTGLDPASRQPIAGPYAVGTGGVKKLAGELLKRWDEEDDSSVYVCRMVFEMQQRAGNIASMDRIAYRIAQVWENRSLALALPAARHAVLVAERTANAAGATTEAQEQQADILRHCGDMLQTGATTSEALAAFRKAHAIRERLAAQDPDNAGWQGDLSVSYNCIGGILESQGDLAGALEEFRKDLAISERLAAQDPDNAGWQRDLGCSHSRIGCIMLAQGDFPGSLEQQGKSCAIMERLAAQDYTNAEWQSALTIIYSRIGDILEAQGDLAGALDQFRKDLVISERLAAQDPANATWQSPLGVSYCKVGHILQAQGDLAGALEQFRMYNIISERLAAQDPDNAGWQRELGNSYGRIGGILDAQGDLAGALELGRKYNDIMKRLAVQDPDKVEWQSSLGISYNNIGDILKAQGDLAGALEEFRKDLSIRERLAAQDPANAWWQSDLGVSYTCIGGILQSQGDLAGALEEFRKALAISERLAAQDPANAGWQRELGVSYNKIGGILETQGDLAGALEEFRKALAISERLAAQDPANAGWQRDLGVSYTRIGGILQTQGDLDGALEEFRKYNAISERLAAQDPDNAGWQSDLCTSHITCADAALASGQTGEALDLATQAVDLSRRHAPDASATWTWRRWLAISLRRLAAANLDLAQPAVALPQALESQQILDARETEEPGSEDGPRCRIQAILARIHTALNDAPAARSAWTACHETLTRMAAKEPLDAEDQSLLTEANAALAQS
jgi:tetratricopeptide (TPR) repeat protein